MPRRGNIAKRDVLQDPLYNSKLVTRLINNIMLDGKKGVAQKIVYGAFDIVAEKTGKDALEALKRQWKTLCRFLRLKPAEWAARHIRFRWKYVLKDVRLSD